MQQRREAGDTLVEVVFSIAILSVVLVTAFNIANLSYRLGLQARERTQAASLLQQQAERLTAYRDQLSAQATAATPPGAPLTPFLPGVLPSSAQYMNDTLTPTLAPGPGKQQAGIYQLFYVRYTPIHDGPDKVRINIHVEWDSTLGNGVNSSDMQIVLVDRRVPKKDCSVVESCAL
jgi:Tfp pilus assembly protein PilE